MLPITACTIRAATTADGAALERLAALDSRRPLRGEILVAEHDGAIVAALSLEDRSVVADPFRPTANAVALLHARAASVAVYERTPLLRDRLRAAVRIAHGRPAAAV
jgi:hypothetical protein